jgi:hypothetical protein
VVGAHSLSFHIGLTRPFLSSVSARGGKALFNFPILKGKRMTEKKSYNRDKKKTTQYVANALQGQCCAIVGPVNQVNELIQNSPFSTGLLKSKGKNLKFEESTETLFFLFVEMERSLVKTPSENQGFHKTKVHN